MGHAVKLAKHGPIQTTKQKKLYVKNLKSIKLYLLKDYKINKQKFPEFFSINITTKKI